MFFASSTTLLFALCGVILDVNGLTITTAQGLIDFSKNVNSGTSYYGSTVYLGSDIDFNSSLSQEFQPIGFTETNYFNGTFNGQGNIISNLTITTPSSSEYTGLFGYSGGATIRNVVMDASCSVSSSSYSTFSYTRVGGFIGKCETKDNGCLIENSVNMGSVSFGGSIENKNLRLGGIAGELEYKIVGSVIIRNCVNYGAIFNTGTSELAWMGGIVGLASTTGHYKYIQNCANYGTITHSGSTTKLGIGGIIGYTGYVKSENCLSAGRISLVNNPSSNYQGTVMGNVDSDTYIEYCHFTGDVGVNVLCGKGTPASTTGSSSSPMSLNSTLLENLNTQALKNDTWSKWPMLHLDGGTINDLSQDTLIVTQKHFPNPVKEENTFLYWCINTECNDIYDPNTTDISEVTDLYAHYQGIKYTITFIFDNGKENEVRTLNFNEGIAYPENPTKEGYTFTGWSPKPERMPAENITVTAKWSINNYTITFIFNNGKENEVRTLNFNESIVYPENLTKEGFIFNGWYPKPERMPAEDITTTAQWNESTLGSGSSSESDSSSRSRSSSESFDSSQSISSSERDFSSVSMSSSQTQSSSQARSSSKHRSSSESSDVFTEYVEVIFGKKGLTEEDVKEILQEFTKEDFVIGRFEVDNESGEIKVIVGFADSSKAAEFARNINESKGGLENNLIKRVTIVSEQTSFASISIPVLFNIFLI